jgi:D-alanyl-D-alanine carboxypeptidase-like protein
MTLHEMQAAHTLCVAKLIEWVYGQGWELTWGEAYRTQEQAQWDATNHIGIVNSVHCQRLAVDLMLFINGVYQTAAEAYQPLGDYWKTLNPLARWGGDFKSVDADHFSFTWQGTE